MKRSFLTMLCLLSICTYALSLRISLIQALPNTVYVDDNNINGPWNGTPQHPYRNITSGLAHALTGDTVYVYDGTYSEQLIIDKRISLTGENKYSTIIDGKKGGNVIEITANNVNITNFTIINSLPVFEFSGIRLDHSNSNNISHNIITKNYEGIWLENSNNNTLIDNDISNSSEGIYAANSCNNILINNKISNNDFGIVLRESSSNMVFHNSFLGNTWRSVSSVNSTNSWDNGIEGNYWSYYKGADYDHDAIGDTPYVINENNQDNHPIMGVFYDFSVIYEKETYHILTISNSTIYQFQFNETLKMLNFSVMGINNTAGFCRIQFPEQIINKPFTVLVDDKQVNATLLPSSNITQTRLYFTYNHSTREIRIISKPCYELLKEYSILLENYQNLNSTYHQLLANYDLLNQTYWQLYANYIQLSTNYFSLNQTYWEVLADYAQLQENYTTLNQKYQQVLTNYTQLLANFNTLDQRYEETLANYNVLNQTYKETLSNYTKLMTDYRLLDQTHQELITNYSKLQNDYSSIQINYSALLAQYNLLNSAYGKLESEYANTRLALLCISVVATVITLITSSLAIKYRKKSDEQKKMVEKYKNELKRISLLDIARKQFESDVQRRKEKIEKFEDRYGVTVRPHNTLEDVITSLELKKKRENQS
jgi:parallel beta-helix repeat protein